MNKVEAKRIFASIAQLYQTGDVQNFEKDYAEDLIVHLNQENLDLEQLRIRIAEIIQKYAVTELEVKNFIFEDERAGVRIFITLKDREDGHELSDHFFYIYHFKNNQVKESWVLTKLPFTKNSTVR